MDKRIEHPKFIGVVSRIRHVAFVTGEDSGRSALKAKVDSGSYNPNDSDSRSSHTTSLNDALLVFASMDHASLLGLWNLDIEGMW